MGMCVQIEAKDDGTFTVTPCEPKEEQMEMGQEAAGPAMQSLDEALQAAGEMLGQGAQQPQENADDAMAAGFDSVRGAGLNG
jgi:hypothetical protein